MKKYLRSLVLVVLAVMGIAVHAESRTVTVWRGSSPINWTYTKGTTPEVTPAYLVNLQVGDKIIISVPNYNALNWDQQIWLRDTEDAKANINECRDFAKLNQNNEVSWTVEGSLETIKADGLCAIGHDNGGNSISEIKIEFQDFQGEELEPLAPGWYIDPSDRIPETAIDFTGMEPSTKGDQWWGYAGYKFSDQYTEFAPCDVLVVKFKNVATDAMVKIARAETLADDDQTKECWGFDNYTYVSHNAYDDQTKTLSSDNGKYTLRLDINQEWADALNGGERLFIIEGKGFEVDQLYLEKGRKYKWVDLFVPGKYPMVDGALMTDKTAFGYDNIDEKYKWLGTGRVVETTDGAPYAVRYQFFPEWWDEAQLKAEDDSRYDVKRYYHWNWAEWDEYAEGAGLLKDENNTWPLRLSNSIVKNFSQLKRDDKVVINIGGYWSGFLDDISYWANQTTEAQLGTYYPAEGSEDDPWAGFKGFTSVRGKDFNNLGQTVENGFCFEYLVDSDMLEHITRYGLSINGRCYYVNWVKAKVFYDEMQYEPVETDVADTDRYYNFDLIPYNFRTLHNGSKVKIYLMKGNMHDEVVTDYYTEVKVGDTVTNRIYNGSKTEMLEEAAENPAEETAKGFQVQYHYYRPADATEAINGQKEDMVRGRIHTYMFLTEGEHFKAETEASVKAQTKVTIGNSFVDGISDARTYINEKGLYVMEFTVSDDNMVETIKKYGMQVRGKNFAPYETHVDDTVTTAIGVVEQDADSDAPREIYNLQGMRVNNMTPGNIYIVRQGGKVQKIQVK